MERLDVLLRFRGLARDFLKHIHPDRHEGFASVQRLNASVTALVNDLYKFDEVQRERVPARHALSFYVWNENGSHQLIEYPLLFHWPFDQTAGRSALGLFEAARVPVDWSLLSHLPLGHCVVPDEQPKPHGHQSAAAEMIVRHCQTIKPLETNVMKRADREDLARFLKTRPYIQLAQDLDMAACDKAFHLINRCRDMLVRHETRCRHLPVMIFSTRFSEPVLDSDIIKLPPSAHASGIRDIQSAAT